MKKIIITMFTLVLAIGLVACGSKVEEEYAKDLAPIFKAYADGARGLIDQYKAAESLDEIKALDETLAKLKAELAAKINELSEKYKDKLDGKQKEGNSTANKSADEMVAADKAVLEARQKAAEALGSRVAENNK